MKIAVITHAFGVSTFPVVKRLSLMGNEVDFYEICLDRITEFECFESDYVPTKKGVHPLDTKWYRGLDEYMGDAKLNYYYCRIQRPYMNVPLLRNYANWKLRRQMKNLCITIDKKNYDCVLGVGAYTNTYFAHIYNYMRTPMVMILHEIINHYNPNYEKLSPLLDHIFRYNLDVIVLSENVANQAIKYKQASAEKIHVAKLGLSEVICHIPNRNMYPDLNDFVLFYGSIQPYKGVLVLRDAIERHPDCLNGKKLVIAGRGNEEIVNAFKDKRDVVLIPRYISVSEMVELIEKSYCQVMPYISASQSGIPQAVYVYGKPIVATRIPSLMDFVKDEENGLLCNINDPDDLARQLKRLTSDKELYDKCCNNVRRFVQVYPDYSWDLSTKEIAGVLKKNMKGLRYEE